MTRLTPNDPLVSILIPCYNAGLYIAGTLRSCLNQTHAAIEIIVVDDGSTDNSAQVVEQLADARIRLIRQPNGGSCRARNEALGNATGEFVLFLDADDFLADHAIAELISRIGSYDAVYCDAHVVDPAGQITGERLHRPIHSDMIVNWFNKAPLPGCVLLRRKAIVARWSNEYDVIDEFDFFVSNAVSGLKITYTPQKLFFYREHASADRKTNQIKSYTTPLIQAFEKYYHLLNQADAFTGKRKLYLSFAFMFFLSVLFKEDKSKYDACIRKYDKLVVRQVSLYLNGLDIIRGIGYKDALKRMLKYHFYLLKSEIRPAKAPR